MAKLAGCLITSPETASGLRSRNEMRTLTSPLLAERAVLTLFSGAKPVVVEGCALDGVARTGEKVA
jgi:hypothetical protein